MDKGLGWLKQAYSLDLGFFIASMSLVAFGKLVSEILEQETAVFDQQVYAWFRLWQSPWMDTFMVWMTRTGGAVGVVGLSLSFILWLYFFKKDGHAIRLFLVANIGGVALNNLLKFVLRRDRPLIDPGIGAIGYSLPSGHAMGAMIFYGFIAYLILRSQRERWLKVTGALFSVVFILMIGASRVYLNAHYASDVLAGYAAGLFWLSACVVVAEKRTQHGSS